MLDGLCKVSQLLFDGQVVATDERKVVLAVEEFFYKEGLAYAATAINDNKLRLVTFQAAVEFFYFAISSNKVHRHPHAVSLNILKNWTNSFPKVIFFTRFGKIYAKNYG